MKISFTTGSSEQTERFGEALSKYLEAGTVIALDGDLGAGHEYPVVVQRIEEVAVVYEPGARLCRRLA